MSSSTTRAVAAIVSLRQDMTSNDAGILESTIKPVHEEDEETEDNPVGQPLLVVTRLRRLQSPAADEVGGERPTDGTYEGLVL